MEKVTYVDAASRIALAKSILNHRLPSSHVIDLTIAALEGATIDDLMGLEEAA